MNLSPHGRGCEQVRGPSGGCSCLALSPRARTAKATTFTPSQKLKKKNCRSLSPGPLQTRIGPKITLSVDLREPRATNFSGDPETGVLWVLGSKGNVELEKLVNDAEGGSRVRPATRRHNKSPMRDSFACRKDFWRRREVSHAIGQTCFGLVPCDRFSTRTVPLL